jgi:hypothetical protein
VYPQYLTNKSFKMMDEIMRGLLEFIFYKSVFSILAQTCSLYVTAFRCLLVFIYKLLRKGQMSLCKFRSFISLFPQTFVNVHHCFMFDVPHPSIGAQIQLQGPMSEVPKLSWLCLFSLAVTYFIVS